MTGTPQLYTNISNAEHNRRGLIALIMSQTNETVPNRKCDQ